MFANPLSRMSSDQCLKFCDDMPPLQRPTINNTQNLGLDCLVTQFSSWDPDQLKCMLMDCLVHLRHDTLNRAIKQLLKRLTVQGKGCQHWISFGLTVYANHHCCYFTVCWAKNWVKFMRCQIRRNFKCIKYLCKLHKEYLISWHPSLANSIHFLDKIWKLLTYQCLLTTNCYEVINSQKQSTFWPTL